MFAKFTRLFGGQEPGESLKKSSNKREEGDGWDATSSKKVRVDMIDETNGQGDFRDRKIDQVQDVVLIVEEVVDKVETDEKAISDKRLVEKVSGLEQQLSIANAELKFLHSSASALILCSICKELPRSLPIFSCNTHHKVCMTCSSVKPFNCPTCYKPLCKESSPLLTALLSTLSRDCTWSTKGCSFRSRLDSLVKHEKKCKYQAVSCWGCQANAPLHLFDQHDPNLACFSFNKVHKSPMKKILLNAISKFNGQFPLQHSGDVEWNPLAVKYAGKMFYLRIKRIARRSIWVLYTAAQMLPVNCSQYLATITLSCPDMDTIGTTWTYTGPPASLVIGLEKVLKEGNCLVMTDPAMEQLMMVDKDRRGTLFTVMVELVANKSEN